jgi:ATP-grasp domain
VKPSDIHSGAQARSRVLLASSTWWPLAAKLAVAFIRNGCVVDAVCGRDHPFLLIKGFRKIYPYRGLNSLQSLYESIVSSDPELVVPCDDNVVWQLHELHRTKVALRDLIERSLGAASGYAVVAGRPELMEVAQDLGIRTPRTMRVKSAADLKEWFATPGASGVLKADRTYAGKSVSVVHSLAEAEEAMLKLQRSASLFKALGRWLLIHDSVAVWYWREYGRTALSLQRLIDGVPANTMLACRNGRVLAMVTVEVLCAQGRTGASLVVKLIENEEIRIAAGRIAERLQLSGFHGLDFILEAGTGDAYLIELNPRCTQLGHLEITGQGDLAGVLCGTSADAALRGRRRRRRAIGNETIAFFPQILWSSPEGVDLRDAYVDVPWYEPRLVQEMMRRDWRDRRLVVRAYHAIRPPHRPVVVFDDASPAGEGQVQAVALQAILKGE